MKEVDRVGRMADALEFIDLALPLARFAPELLEQLRELAPSSLEVDGEHLIVTHCYVERRMTPLDLYLARAHARPRSTHAVREYGDAIRELAIANVFAGDLLWRNFGLNRARPRRLLRLRRDRVPHRLRLPDDPEAAGPRGRARRARCGIRVGRSDVFPEEFEHVPARRPGVREAFLRHHAELLRPEFWQDCQRRVAEGEIVDFFPYPESVRFRRAA